MTEECRTATTGSVIHEQPEGVRIGGTAIRRCGPSGLGAIGNL
jgi:hypothetical protein